LLEDSPIVRFPRKKRKYTKHKKPGIEANIVGECDDVDNRPDVINGQSENHKDIDIDNGDGDGLDCEGDDDDGGLYF